MKLRAALFDVYGTLLELGPTVPPESRQPEWTTLHRQFFAADPDLAYAELLDLCRQRIAREHTAARALGILHPEILWPDIVAAAWPPVLTLAEPKRNHFLFELATLSRTTRLADGAAATLRTLRQSGLLLGIASNAQAYSLRELEIALEPDGLSLALFRPNLCFWSFEHGFSKPNPHVFRLLATRLQALGIQPSEILMVGDRSDNDIAPARAAGWRTWHLHPAGSGRWPDLLAWFQATHAST